MKAFHSYIVAIFAAAASLPSPGYGNIAALCVTDMIAARQIEGHSFAISEPEARSFVERVARSIGLPGDDIEVFPCNLVENAVAWAPARDTPEIPLARYIVYNPDYIRIAVGKNDWQAIAILGHELGHFVAGDFPPSGRLTTAQREARADRFAGCAVARLGGPWSEVEDLLSRLRRDQGNDQYPSRSESLEQASIGFTDCGGDTPPIIGGDTPPVSGGDPNIDQLTGFAGSWVWVGTYQGGRWLEKNFEWPQSNSPYPMIGGMITASTPVNIRSDHIKYSNGAWRNSSAVGGVKRGESLRIDKVVDVTGQQGFIWAQIME